MKNQIEKILSRELSPTYINVVDDSHLHVGHAGAREGGNSHFTVEIVSNNFEGKNLVQRHRMIYAALKKELETTIHALVIKAYTPQERN